MDRLIRMEPSNQVTVRVEPGQRCSGQLTLRNVMYTMPVAFRLLSTNRARFTIRPQTGIIAPLAALRVEITYLPPAPLLPDTSPECDEGFILDSVVSPCAAFKEGASVAALDAVPADWFTIKKKLVFTDSGLRVFFAGSTVVSHLIESGDMEKLREVLERSNPEWRAADSADAGGRPLLHIAIALRRPDLVQLICEFGADVEARGGTGRSPLEAAAAAGESVIAELLIARGASAERSPGSAWGPLHHAAAGGHAELLRLLLLKDAAADGETADGRTALHLAAAERRWECVRILLAAGARTDACGGSARETPLHVVAAAGDESTARMLIAGGCVGLREARNGAGKTAYDIAAANGHRRLFGLLRADERLAAGARKGEVREVERAIEMGAAADARDAWGWTALMRAGLKGNVEVIRVLLEKGAAVGARDVDGYTALHCAAEGGQAEAVEVLVKRGADVEARTKKGRTAAEISASLGYASIVRMLEQGGPAEAEIAARRPPVPPAVDGKGKKKGTRIVAGGDIGGGKKAGFVGRAVALAMTVASC